MNKYVFTFAFLMFFCSVQAEHTLSICRSNDSKATISAYCKEGLNVDSLKMRIANCETLLSKLDTVGINRPGINDTIAKVNAELNICDKQLKQYNQKVETEIKKTKNNNTTLLCVLAVTIFILILDLSRIIKKTHKNNNLRTFQNSHEPDIKEDNKGGSEEIETIKETVPEINSSETEVEKDIDIESETESPTIEISDFDSSSVTSRIRRYTEEDNVIGVSLQGDNHVKMNPEVPCQDYHAFTKIDDFWSVAIVSDGAGSKKMSHKGSEAVCLAFTAYLKNLLLNDTRFKDGSIVDSKTWDIEFRTILSKFQSDIKSLVTENNTFDSYSATIIVLAYSSKGYMVGHVGDGRAGVLTNGEWKSIINPHKGEEANQTIFSTTLDFSKNPNLRMSGIYVPETSVSSDVLDAFVLISDGCEQGLWVTYQREELPDGDFRIVDKNKPRIGSLEALFKILSCEDSIEKKNYLVDYLLNDKIMLKEGDDKTILLGKL